jgi:carotenoid cleavage dioxygenase-like enzyme
MHPWFRTLTEEVRDSSLTIEGSVPTWLDGTLVRNGPAHFDTAAGRVSHWFDGLAMLRRFAFHDGAVGYTNRFLRTAAYRSRVDGVVAATEFGTGPTSLVRRLVATVLPTATDNANVTVARLGGRYVALTETPRMVVFDPETLLTFGERTFDDDVPGQWTAAHVERDRERGEVIGHTVRFGRESSYHVYRLRDGTRTRTEIARIPVDEPAYVHSVGLTDRYVVLPEVPFTADPRRFLRPGVEAFVDAFRWDESRPTRFHVVDRDDGSVRTVDAPPFFFFHTVNAFEPADRDGVVVDLVAFEDASIVDALAFDRVGRGVREATGDLRRYWIPLDGDGPATSRPIAEHVALPRIDPVDRRRPYRHVYAQRTGDVDATGLVRVDVTDGTETVWRERGCFAGEPVFVPRTPQSEDGHDGVERDGSGEGVVLAVVLDRDAERSFLVVLDGATFEERARAWLPHALPLGFHGEYFE